MAYDPLFMRDAVLTIAGTDHAVECSSILWTPSPTSVTYKGLKPNAIYTAAGTATWEFAPTFAQDWDETTSLAIFLHENEGEQVAIVVEPKDGGASFAATITVVPGAIGGAVDSFAESAPTMPSTKPVRTAAA